MDTLLRFAPGEPSAAITETATDPDGLNFLAGRTLADLEETAWDTLLNGNLDGDVPTVSLDGAVADEAALGWLYGFFRLSAALWEKLSGNTEENREEALLRALGKPQC